jgi:hypothetical protein
MTWRHSLKFVCLASTALALPRVALGDMQTTTQTLTANVSSSGKVSLPVSASLQKSGSQFESFSGSLLVSYWARTLTGGSGSVSLQALSDFSPTGGPSVDSVTYTCSGATLGSPCSGSQAISTVTQSPVVTLPGGVCTGGGSPCSTQEPNTVLLQFNTPSKPSYKTGTFSVQITLTISTP